MQLQINLSCLYKDYQSVREKKKIILFEIVYKFANRYENIFYRKNGMYLLLSLRKKGILEILLEKKIILNDVDSCSVHVLT